MLEFRHRVIRAGYKCFFFIGLGFYILLGASFSLAESVLEDPFNVTAGLNNSAKPASCNSSDIKKEINLINAIDIALCNNPQTSSSWFIAKTAAANLGQARGDYLPTVLLDGDIARNYNNRSSSGTTPSLSNSSSVGLDLSYLIYDFGGRESAVESSKQQMFQASFSYNSLIQSMVFQVIKGYLDVFTANETLDAARSAEVASKEAFDVAKGKLKVGLVTKADTAQAETAYSQNILAVEKAANALKLANGSFSVLLHLPPTYELKLAPVDPERIGRPLSGDVENYIKQALARRPDLAASLSREKQFEADLRNADAADYPTISILGSAANTDYSTGLDRSQADNSIRLNLSMPLFTGFKNTYQQLAAKNALASARADRAKTEDDVKLDVWNSYHNYQTSQQTYETAQVLINSAEASEAIALGRYKVGKGTLTDALDAQAKLADARRQLVEARYNTLITRFDLLRALGNEEWNRQLAPVISGNNVGANFNRNIIPANNNIISTNQNNIAPANNNIITTNANITTANPPSNNENISGASAAPATGASGIVPPKMHIIFPTP